MQPWRLVSFMKALTSSFELQVVLSHLRILHGFYVYHVVCNLPPDFNHNYKIRAFCVSCALNLGLCKFLSKRWEHVRQLKRSSCPDLWYATCDAKALKIVSLILRLKEDAITSPGFEEAESTYFHIQHQPDLEAFTLGSKTQWSPFRVVTSGYISQQCFTFPGSLRPHCVKKLMWYLFFWNTTWKKGSRMPTRPCGLAGHCQLCTKCHICEHVVANTSTMIILISLASPLLI